MYIKYFVNPMFKKDEFVDLLNSRGVEAAAVDDGIILDHDAFNAIRVAHMPHWMYLNRQYINSKLHTRPASMKELRDAQDKAAGMKVVGAYTTSVFGGWEFGQKDHDLYCRVIHDNYYGEWEAIDNYDIADDDCTIIYHLRGGLDVSSKDIMRV